LKTELYSSLVAELLRLFLPLREVIGEASQQVLKLRWPDGDLLSHRDVDASADEEIKRIVTRGLAMRRRPTLVMAFWQQAGLFPV
jgi:hypothetical protein